MKPSEATKGGKITQFINCRLLRDHMIITEDLWVRDGKILNPEKLFFDEKVSADEYVDCHGKLIVPGFIDVQINGGFGVDFSMFSATLSEDVGKVAKGLLEHGVTSFCPTLVTSTPKLYKQVLACIKRVNGSKDGAGILGVHLEGPFISKEKKGAHDESAIITLSNGMSDVLEVYGSLEHVSMVTLAPELPGALDVVRKLTESGIAVSLGHSMANLSEGEAAVKAGAKFVTHLFNAMLPFHHRDPHLVGLLASREIPQDTTLYYGLISDGIHTHPAALRIAQRTHPKGVVLVTDAISALGLPSGVHQLGSHTIEIKGKRAVLEGTETLCGSIVNMSECVKFFLSSAECSVVDAIEAATLHPASLLNITDYKGTLDYGTDADFILLDTELSVLATYIDGHLVWRIQDFDLAPMTRRIR